MQSPSPALAGGSGCSSAPGDKQALGDGGGEVWRQTGAGLLEVAQASHGHLG